LYNECTSNLERHYFDTAIKSLDEVLKQEPDNRFKDLIVTVRGSGGGKTRMLEELRRATNCRNNAVAIGVTLYMKRDMKLSWTEKWRYQYHSIDYCSHQLYYLWIIIE
jgi:uridine kinase